MVFGRVATGRAVPAAKTVISPPPTAASNSHPSGGLSASRRTKLGRGVVLGDEYQQQDEDQKADDPAPTIRRRRGGNDGWLFGCRLRAPSEHRCTAEWLISRGRGLLVMTPFLSITQG